MKVEKWEDLRKLQIPVMICNVMMYVSFGFYVLGQSLVKSQGSSAAKWEWITWLAALAGLIIFSLLFMNRRRVYADAYKKFVIDQAAKDLFDNYTYYPKAGYDVEYIRNTGIMSMGNTFKSEDLVEGAYKGVSFRRADVYIAVKSKNTNVLLRGTWCVFAYNKGFTTDIQIFSNDFRNEVKKSSIFTSKDVRRHKVQSEDVDFNSQFTCTCQNDNEAFYILTPHMMQMLKELKKELRCPIMLGFKNDSMHFVIQSGKDNMEPPIYGKLNLYDEIVKNRMELTGIRRIVDVLAIDREIYK